MTTAGTQITELFITLAKINATSKAEKPVADFLKSFLKQRGIETIEDNSGTVVDGSCGNIMAKIGGDATPKISFTAHMDTVKPTADLNPVCNNGIIKSDGTTILGADNRAGISIILYTIDRILKNGQSFAPFEIIFTIGEETGLFGSGNLQIEHLKSRIAYTLDSSADPGKYVMAAPGAYEFKISLYGKASHAAVNPSAGINAITMAADLLKKLKTGQVDEHSTINIGRIQGGEANNVIPPQVNLSGEVRSFKEELLDKHISEIETRCKEVSEAYKGTFSFQKELAFPGFALKQETPAIRILDNALCQNGLTPGPLTYHGASDANVLNGRGITCIDLGIGAKNPHSFDEYIAVADMLKMSDVMLSLIEGQSELP